MLLKSLALNFIKGTVLSLLLLQSASAYDPKKVTKPSTEVPNEIKGVGIKENLGQNLNLDLKFFDESGSTVSLGKYFNSGLPVVFSIVYYDCPSLCNYHLNGVIEVLRKIDLTVGRDFQIVALSMDHNEGPEIASDKRDAYVAAYGRPGSKEGWHFLTGTKENIKKVADNVGFSFKWVESTKQYSHASAAIIVTPEGKISRYLHGIAFDQKTFKLALLEGSRGKIGNIMDQLVLYCFQFDPTTKKYSLYAFNIMRVAAAFTVLVMIGIFVPIWMKNRNGQTPA